MAAESFASVARSHRAGSSPIRVAVVEDDKTMREMLASTIGRATSLVLSKAFSDAESALREIGEVRPDVLVVDLKLPGHSGVECTRLVKQAHPEIQVVILTVFFDTESVMEALKAGASGYLIKRASSREIVKAIEEVWEGGAPMSPGIARRVVEALHEPPDGERQARGKSWSLTEREHDILKLLATGLTAKEIADRLYLSEPTIRFHLRHVYQKLHVRSRSEAIIKFLK